MRTKNPGTSVAGSCLTQWADCPIHAEPVQKLLYTAIRKLVAAAKERSILLRQSYLRVGKRAAVKTGRYAHAKQFKRMRRQLRKLRTYVGRLIRDIRRKASQMDDDLVARGRPS